MDLWLFCVLMLVALVMVAIGLSKPSESAQGLIGFFFLFLLGLTLLNGSLELKTGEITQTNYTYTGGNLSQTNEVTIYQYSNYNTGFFSNFGFYLCIASAVGFAGVLFGLKRTRDFNND